MSESPTKPAEQGARRYSSPPLNTTTAPTPVHPPTTTTLSAIAMPWDPTQNEDPDARRRENLRQQYERENPFRLTTPASATAPPAPAPPARGRSMSPPASLPPLCQRSSSRPYTPNPQLPPMLPSLSDLGLVPFQSVQPRESTIRSTINLGPLPNSERAYTEHNTGWYRESAIRSTLNLGPLPNSKRAYSEENTGRYQYQPNPIILPLIRNLGTPDVFSTFSTPSRMREDQDTPRRVSTSPATTFPDPDDTVYEADEVAEEEDESIDGIVGENEGDCIICEFSNPCRMGPSPDGKHFRKVVSHVFGRNKASTRLFPSGVWVHYCRKHYQRARYRADQWPFTQCELLLESIERMQKWGGVKEFEMILRRRELNRIKDGKSSKGKPKSSSGLLQSGRKHPTAVVAPTPEWLRQYCGRDMSFDDIRHVIIQIRDYMMDLREKEKVQDAQADAMVPSASKKTEGLRQRPSRVRFPDVEILPRFKNWVIKASLAKRAGRQAQTEQRVDEAEEEEEEEENEASNDGEGLGGPLGDDQHDDQHDDHDNDHDDQEGTPDGDVPQAEANASLLSLFENNVRRSERIFLRTIEEPVRRVSSSGSVKKPSVKKPGKKN